MGHKIGKYSSPINGGGPKTAPFKNSNGGHAQRESLSNEFRKIDPRQKPKPTYAGTAADPTARARK